MLTCGTKVGLWRHKTSMEQGTLGYRNNRYDESFFVTKFAWK
jgi:hypothetical protein